LTILVPLHDSSILLCVLVIVATSIVPTLLEIQLLIPDFYRDEPASYMSFLSYM